MVKGTLSTVTEGKVSSVTTTGNDSKAEVLKVNLKEVNDGKKKNI